ncbi:hypothetical protein ILUMI_07976 [Ignelater luminosus]|uniref:Uncharacterized protein n=1 Tax=Ignelater luminosus TaxID=2038154 RepID=A0A8K0GGC8_IGNLU|nr:hypothetical protein ILUMI_07976 [Ignelater luminosus]
MDKMEENFCETYADKSWTPVRYAILFKYIAGSLLEYALKIERLLLEMNRLINKITLINLIAAGLPNFVSDKIDRKNLNQSEDLFNERRILERLMYFQQQSAIDELIHKHKSLFAKDKYDTGMVKNSEAHIDLLIDKYCCNRPYRTLFHLGTISPWFDTERREACSPEIEYLLSAISNGELKRSQQKAVSALKLPLLQNILISGDFLNQHLISSSFRLLWGKTQQSVLECLKLRLNKLAVLTLFDAKLETKLQDWLGASLLQKQADENWKAVFYMSQQIPNVQQIITVKYELETSSCCEEEEICLSELGNGG